MATPENVFLGIGPCGSAIHIVSSLGQRSSITADGIKSVYDWIELATYGIPLPEPHVLHACIAIPSGYPEDKQRDIREAARQAGWDGVLLVNSLRAVRRALEPGGAESGDLEGSLLVVVDREVTSVGVFDEGARVFDDPVRLILGREAREVAVSLRCLLKQRPRQEVRPLLRKVVVAGDANEIQRIGRRSFERELEQLGIERVEFEPNPFLLAEGAARLAEETKEDVWRRLRRRRR